MKSEHFYDSANRHTVATTTLTDREVAMTMDRRLMLEEFRQAIVYELAKAVMQRLGPAIDKALQDFALETQ